MILYLFYLCVSILSQCSARVLDFCLQNTDILIFCAWIIIVEKICTFVAYSPLRYHSQLPTVLAEMTIVLLLCPNDYTMLLAKLLQACHKVLSIKIFLSQNVILIITHATFQNDSLRILSTWLFLRSIQKNKHKE